MKSQRTIAEEYGARLKQATTDTDRWQLIIEAHLEALRRCKNHVLKAAGTLAQLESLVEDHMQYLKAKHG